MVLYIINFVVLKKDVKTISYDKITIHIYIPILYF